jgi:CubicO group peptidase (beta-lactamase class C family)
VFSLRKSVAAAQEQTGVPDVAAALARDGSVELAGSAATPFRIASITKSFTATAVAEAGLLAGAAGGHLRSLLSHTAGYRAESREPLPAACAGLWSYSNAGYWEAGEAFDDYAGAVQELVLDPLGLASTSFTRPADGAFGHQPDGVVSGEDYPAHRRPGGGLWSTVTDLVAYGLAHTERWPELHEPVIDALGEQYALGWWARRGGILDHEGSIAGFQSLLLLVPAERLVLAVLTNSWRGSALIRHVVDDLGVVQSDCRSNQIAVDGTYRLDALEADVQDGQIVERETDPVTGAVLERRYPFAADASLMSWRSDFPRDGVARIGWTALPRVAE